MEIDVQATATRIAGGGRVSWRAPVARDSFFLKIPILDFANLANLAIVLFFLRISE